MKSSLNKIVILNLIRDDKGSKKQPYYTIMNHENINNAKKTLSQKKGKTYSIQLNDSPIKRAGAKSSEASRIKF